MTMIEKEYIEREALQNKAFGEEHPTFYDGQDIADWYEKCINETAAADVAPIRHGRWETGYFHDRVCSCCLHPDNDINDYPHSYCPHCGAKMDEKERDEND